MEEITGKRHGRKLKCVAHDDDKCQPITTWRRPPRLQQQANSLDGKKIYDIDNHMDTYSKVFKSDSLHKISSFKPKAILVKGHSMSNQQMVSTDPLRFF